MPFVGFNIHKKYLDCLTRMIEKRVIVLVEVEYRTEDLSVIFIVSLTQEFPQVVRIETGT